MSRLTRGMYEGVGGQPSKLFGLDNYQFRPYRVVHNGEWFNSAGERLGWGDLNLADFDQITERIEPGEVFIITSEGMVYDYFSDKGQLESYDPGAPGVDAVVASAWFAITVDGIFTLPYHDDDEHHRDGEATVHHQLGEIKCLTHAGLAKLLSEQPVPH